VPKKIIFKESGEEFEIIIMKLELHRGLLKKRSSSFSWDVPPNASYEIYHGGEPKTTTSRDELDKFYYIKFTNPLRKDTIVIASVLLFLIIVVVIIYR